LLGFGNPRISIEFFAYLIEMHTPTINRLLIVVEDLSNNIYNLLYVHSFPLLQIHRLNIGYIFILKIQRRLSLRRA